MRRDVAHLAGQRRGAGARRQATHPPARKPELVATKPSKSTAGTSPSGWEPEKWTYFYLYVVIDIYSRYVPGWMLAGPSKRTCRAPAG